MSTYIKKFYLFFLKKPIRKIKLISNKIGNNKKCYVCNNTFNHFSKWKGGEKNLPIWYKKLEIEGGDFDNFECPCCGSTDRERHLFMYFDKLNLWDKIESKEILHFAPEINFSKKIEQYKPLRYIKGDLYSQDITIQKIDATAISFNDATFDIVICNHVLEHIPHYKTAMSEIFRVLKPGGMAILQTPYSRLLENNFEDEGINTDELRSILYGQIDHVRVFSEKIFYNGLNETGFILNIVKHEDVLKELNFQYLGVSINENLIKVLKPSN